MQHIKEVLISNDYNFEEALISSSRKKALLALLAYVETGTNSLAIPCEIYT